MLHAAHDPLEGCLGMDLFMLGSHKEARLKGGNGNNWIIIEYHDLYEFMIHTYS
jgi:hypothetical protein